MLRVWILWEKSRTIGILLTLVGVISGLLGLGLIRVDIKVGNAFIPSLCI